MKRILYFTGHRLTAQEWDRGFLNTSIFFEPDEQGLELFRRYLRAKRRVPVHLMMDIIEEEFRAEDIPHVNVRDRRALFERMQNKYFRMTPFRYSAIQGRRKTGRRDDRALFSALTNPALFKVWLDVIAECRVPLAGIYSLSMVSEKLLPTIGASDGCVMLVSQQVPSNLRQSVFVGGKLVLSRLVPIGSFFEDGYASDLVHDIRNTHRYLLGQRVVARSDVVNVHIIAAQRHVPSLNEQCENTPGLTFHLHEVNDLKERLKIETNTHSEFSGELYCGLLGTRWVPNHYAGHGERRYWYHYLTGWGMAAASVLVLGTGIALAASRTTEGLLYEMYGNEMQNLTLSYQHKFRRIKAQMGDLPLDSNLIKTSVDVAIQLENDYAEDPEPMLRVISNDLGAYPGIVLNRLSWFVADSPDRDSHGQVNWGNEDKRARRVRRRTTEDGLFEIVIVDADLFMERDDLRYALNFVSQLERDLRGSGNYERVEILRRPVDLRSETGYSGQEGLNRESSVNASFTLKLVRKQA
jgi:hypothetical protein